MSCEDPYELMREIAALNIWDKAARHNWALVSQNSEEPWIVTVLKEGEKSVVAARLLMFQGLARFRDFMVQRQMPDYGVAASPLEFAHWEAVALKNGRVELFIYEPGFVPLPPNDRGRRLMADLLHECLGVLLRLDGQPELLMTYVKQNALFARKEIVPGSWMDGPLKLPENEKIEETDSVSVDKKKCDLAKALPVYPKKIWELDFVLLPSFHTPPPNPRFLYLLVAVDADTGEKILWERMSVDGKEGGLKRMWEGHAQRLLDRISQRGEVPGEIHVRSFRMMRFIRPLGLYLPFKLMKTSHLPALDSVLSIATSTRNI